MTITPRLGNCDAIKRCSGFVKRGEWPNGPASSISFTEAWLCTVRNCMGDLPDERPKQITPPSFGRDVKLRVPFLDAASIAGLN